jgi:DNA polymerase-4
MAGDRAGTYLSRVTRPSAAPRTRRILLVDADAFFVAVARQVDPEGAGRATLLIVGGTRESRGVVCSASYETRSYGVRSAMPISQALRLCPAAVCVPVPRAACSARSREIRRVLERIAPVVEGASVDEWYCDLSGTEALYSEPLAATAARLREMVRAETGLSVSIGGGTNKLVAKLAVELAKPKPGTGATGVQVVDPGGEAEFLKRFRLADIPMVGPKFQQRLASLGMTTVPDVLQYDERSLARWIGENAARWLYDQVRGLDDRAVAERDLPRSISREDTFPEDIDSDEELERELLRLVVRAASDLRGDGLTARTISVKLRDGDFRTRRASRTLAEPVVADRVIHEVARELFRGLRAARRVPVRLVGVHLSALAEDADAQLALFEREGGVVESARDRALSGAVDALRARFGPDAILPARLKE